MKYIIFYSWQSDLPNNTNRGFLESVMNTAIQDFKNNNRYELDPSIDRDTKNIPGSPNITQAIIDKIRTSDAFVADISIVTGDKGKGQRLSPNPNVMLELGYAIGLLGWDRIILFCNESYGKVEDLPFDIRQHRQIKYSLAQTDKKSELKRELSNLFGKRLVELVDHHKSGKVNSKIREPNISAKWSFWDNVSENCDEGFESDVIKLEQANVPPDIEIEINSDIERVKKIDGSFDPTWNDKLNEYLRRAEAFIIEKQKLKNTEADIIISNKDKVKIVTLSVGNSGNARATDIKINIEIPKWIISFKKFPDFKNEKPLVPTPKRPVISSTHGIDQLLKILPSGPSVSSLSFSNKVTAACYLNSGRVEFWADELLHKHHRTVRDDTFYLLASSEAPIGESVIKGEVFCSEFEDWKEINLKVLIS